MAKWPNSIWSNSGQWKTRLNYRIQGHLHTSSNELARLARLLLGNIQISWLVWLVCSVVAPVVDLWSSGSFIHCRAKWTKRATTYIHSTLSAKTISSSFFSSTAEPIEPPRIYTQHLTLKQFIPCSFHPLPSQTSHHIYTLNTEVVAHSSTAEPNEPNEPPHIYTQHLTLKQFNSLFFSSTAEPNEPPNLNAFKNGPVSCSCSENPFKCKVERGS